MTSLAEDKSLEKPPSSGGQCAANGYTAFRKEVVGDCILYHGDCLEILPFLDGVDAVISDPPYGINFDFSKSRARTSVLARGYGPYQTKDRNWQNIEGDNKPFDPSHLLDFDKIVLWGGNHYADKLPAGRGWLVWDKKCHTSSDNHGDCELAWTNLSIPVRRFFHLWRGAIRAGRENPKNGEKLHPAQKPEALMSWCISLCKLGRGSVVLDPYMGSGTTGISCIKHGMKFIGIEKDATHFKNALERIKKECSQGRLF